MDDPSGEEEKTNQTKAGRSDWRGVKSAIE
jgi:hypothetical protein